MDRGPGPASDGRVAVVTGANSGLGLGTAREHARAGARVKLTARDRAKGEEAARSIGRMLPARYELGPVSATP